MAETTKVTVKVVAREGFNGFWSAGKHFQGGDNLVELTADEVKAIEADAALGLPISLVGGWPAPSAAEEQAAEKAAAEKAAAEAKAKADAEAAELAKLEAEEQAAAAKKGKQGKQ